MSKILIIEDEESLQQALVNKFQSNGHKTLIASNGKQGLELALTEIPDLILLDILMPEMTGSEMLTKLRESGEWGAHAKVIVLTNLDPDSEMLKQMTINSPSYYILKADISLDEVVQKANEILTQVK